MDTVKNSNVSQINEVEVEEEIAKNGFEISFGRESIEPAQMNNRGASKKSQQAENEKSKKIKTDQQINQNLNPILIPKDVNDDNENEMISKNENDFDKQNNLAKKEVNSSLERQKKETKIRKELEGRLSDLSESEIFELVSKFDQIMDVQF